MAFEHFNAWEEEYRHVRWAGPLDISSLQEELEEGELILDAGCGHGRYAISLSHEYTTMGCDVSQRGLLRLQEKAELPLCRASITDLPFPEDSFDVVLCQGVLQHLFEAERKQAADQMTNVLKPGGKLIFEAFGRQDMRYGGEAVEQHTFRRKNGIIYHYFIMEELEDLFDKLDITKKENRLKKKIFRGREYTRHSIFFVARKPSEEDSKMVEQDNQ
ncbi:class I SAM-dependent methyltransferase [Methanohalophilus mahii]|uniref:Methyltransferase type 11 n=1 Tax=Methanohalophilus mahii (strain ATCC 35705 / DSM 5219 / SLP) TaxID=547558 RepID=D5E899_METMS|nr:class I SAM-dependent methyltransferase [Methanohalophilus mahii]ADE37387.1 Methyltransferase type 11 [Methanohalophilus mahii DSM 5219]